ncbi:MAG: efflux RND transporter periplasmic adaptor subunit [Vicinamibacteria bacterium]
MSRKKRFFLAGIPLVLIAAGVGGYFYYQRQMLPEVEVEAIARRKLEAVVSASGKVQPKRLVNISADTIGRVTKLSVEEGDLVAKGQFLLQIDPETLASAVELSEAGLGAAREAVGSAKVAVETARANLDLSEQNLSRITRLHRDQLVSQEVLDRAEAEVKVRRSELEARETEVRAMAQRLEQEVAGLRSARHNLSKVTIVAPMDGLVSRLNIEEGETVLVGTMNNPGTVLMTIADMSVVQAELEVDETDIIDVALGQVARVEIDAFPDRELEGRVTKIGSSSLEPDVMSGNQRQATMFEVEVTLDGQVLDARPGFSCTADITTATRLDVVSVPIQALTVREVYPDSEGNLHTRTRGEEWEPPEAIEPDEVEGVFVVRDGKAYFTPVQIGIAGEQYFELESGLAEGDEVIIGPFDSVRDLMDQDEVRIREEEDEGLSIQ